MACIWNVKYRPFFTKVVKGEDYIMDAIYPKLTRSAGKVYIIGGIMLMLIGVGITFGVGHDLFHYLFIDEPDLFESKSSSYEEGEWFTCDNNILFDYFASDDSGRYYLTNTNDGEYFGFYVRNKDIDKAEQICDETYDYLDGKRDDLSDVYLSGKGYMVEMSTSEQRYLRDYIEASGYEVEDYNLIYLTYRLETPWGLIVDNEGENNLFYMIVGLVLFISGIIMIIYFLSGGYKKNIKKSIKSYGILEELLDRDMSTAKQIGDYFVGTEHLVSCNIPGTIVIPYNVFVWVYVQVTKTKHTVYGIIPAGTSTSYQLVIYDRNKRKQMLNLKSQEQGDEIIQEMYGRAPYFLRGFNDNFANAVTNNFQSMVNAVDERRQQVIGGGY
jgi:hypothetical protein